VSRDGSIEKQVQAVLAELKKLATKATRDGMARYAIPNEHAFGVPMATMQALAKRLGRNHELAAGLWETGWYEARTVAALIDEPDLVTAAQMDRWAREFGNWAVCDSVCFFLFDRTPHAFRKVEQWARHKDEYVKRGAFALLASLAAHDKLATDDDFMGCLPLVEEAAPDERNFVKKGVSWALRMIGRRSPELNAASVAVARRLAESGEPAAWWIGKGAVRELTSPTVKRALESKVARAAKKGAKKK
jgi:3-methyladenine DNA glycosylase AlkD